MKVNSTMGKNRSLVARTNAWNKEFGVPYRKLSYQNGEGKGKFLTCKKGNVSNRKGNKIWKEKARRGISKKDSEQKNSCRRSTC